MLLTFLISGDRITSIQGLAAPLYPAIIQPAAKAHETYNQFINLYIGTFRNNLAHPFRQPAIPFVAFWYDCCVFPVRYENESTISNATALFRKSCQVNRGDIDAKKVWFYHN